MIGVDQAVSDDWQDYASCVGHNPVYWDGVPVNRSRYAALDFSDAKRICDGCPVSNICLGRAVQTEDVWVMRGGKTPDQLVELVKEHRRKQSSRRTRSLMVVRPRNPENRVSA